MVLAERVPDMDMVFQLLATRVPMLVEYKREPGLSPESEYMAILYLLLEESTPAMYTDIEERAPSVLPLVNLEAFTYPLSSVSTEPPTDVYPSVEAVCDAPAVVKVLSPEE